jgi:peptidoglycan-associated lipoprotein
MLYVGYDDRRGKWKDVSNPCDTCTGSLSTTLSYISIEPSLRIAPFSSGFYIFLGPRLGINMSKTFTYKVTDVAGQKRQDTKDKWSDTRSAVISGQIGMGYDIPLSSPESRTQIVLSPFASYHPYFGQNPRSVENWAVTTVRAGIILKLGRAHQEPPPPPPPVVEKPAAPVVTPPPPPAPPPPDTTGQAARERQARMDADKARIQTVQFDYDKNDIRADQRDKIKIDADIFRTWADWQISVEGYCDERGTSEYNLALGERRAKAAEKALVAEGISAKRITTISYGKERPADPGHDESAWSHNRRTEFKVK